MLRLSETELTDVATAAREAGLTPSGYAAEAALAAARGGDGPVRNPVRVVLAELIAARVDLVRVSRLLAGTAPSDQKPAPDLADLQAITCAVTAVDRAAVAVAQGLR